MLSNDHNAFAMSYSDVIFSCRPNGVASTEKSAKREFCVLFAYSV